MAISLRRKDPIFVTLWDDKVTTQEQNPGCDAWLVASKVNGHHPTKPGW